MVKITAGDREQARRTLLGQEDRDEILCIVDGDGRFLDVSGGLQRASGLLPDALVGRCFADIVVSEDLQATMERFSALKSEGAKVTFTNRCRDGLGKIHHLRWTGTWSAERGLAFVCGRDVTELAEATATLKARGTLLEMAGKLAQFGGWSLDLRDNRLVWSKEIFVILGLPNNRPPLSLAGVMALFTPKSQQVITETLARCRIKGGEFDLELQMSTLTYRRIEVRITGRCEVDGHHQPTHIIGALQDISRQKLAQQDIERLAYFDPLTGLANRQQLHEKIGLQRSICSHKQLNAALLSVNIDNFKTFNNSQGHFAGDQLLMLVGERLSASARDVDLVARTDGDNFVVLMRGLDPDPERAATQTRNLASRIMTSLTETYRLRDGREHRLTISVGIVMFGEVSKSADVLLQQSALAMQAVKADGGHAIRFFDPVLQSAANNRAKTESALRSAIDTDDLFLHFEPQITASGRAVAAEALLRWVHPSLGLIRPADFIPLAEASGLIIPLGRHVLKQACKSLIQWRHHPQTAHLKIAVNISAAEFRHVDFVEQTLAIIADSGVDPRWLTLELTESLLLTDITQVIERMHRLKAHGIRFSLDDFGTGYSSLAYLQQLPLDQLKLDMSFVGKLPDDARSAAIVRTIIALGRSLELELIAEGVETEAQRQFLLDAGCDGLQGHLFTPALTAEALATWLAKRQGGADASP